MNNIEQEKKYRPQFPEFISGETDLQSKFDFLVEHGFEGNFTFFCQEMTLKKELRAKYVDLGRIKFSANRRGFRKFVAVALGVYMDNLRLHRRYANYLAKHLKRRSDEDKMWGIIYEWYIPRVPDVKVADVKATDVKEASIKEESTK